MLWAQTSNCPAIILVRWPTNLKRNTSELASRSGITIPLNIKATSKDEWRNPQHCEKLGKEGRVSHAGHAMPAVTTFGFGTAVWAKTYLQMSRPLLGQGMSSPLLADPLSPCTHSVYKWFPKHHHLAYGRVGEKIKPFPLRPTIHNLGVATHTDSLLYGLSVVLGWRVRVQLAPLSTLWKGHLEVP